VPAVAHHSHPDRDDFDFDGKVNLLDFYDHGTNRIGGVRNPSPETNITWLSIRQAITC